MRVEEDLCVWLFLRVLAFLLVRETDYILESFAML